MSRAAPKRAVLAVLRVEGAENIAPRKACAERHAGVGPPTPETHSPKPKAHRSYIIFECQFAKDLFCAVPKSFPIPDFLVGAAWVFRGTLGQRGYRPSGFRAAAAWTAARRDGFHLYTVPRIEASE